ncbi:MAG: transposase [Gammaproteobacteria bacterium]|nr:MAG: transposase [Gammaproteobacteria bacterium]
MAQHWRLPVGREHCGSPRLPIRLMASLLYLKHAFNLSDEELVVRWSENVVWQYFSGEEYYTSKLPCDATQIGRFRTAIGEAGVEKLLKATIDTAVHTKAVKPAEFKRVIVDTTIQERQLRIRWIAGYWKLLAARLCKQPDGLASPDNLRQSAEGQAY